MAAKLTELPVLLLDDPEAPNVLVLVEGFAPVAGCRLLGERDCTGVLAGVDEPCSSLATWPAADEPVLPVPDCPEDPDGAADTDVPDDPDGAADPPELIELAGVVAGTPDVAGACAGASSMKGSAE
jgi:hypothetical protein